MSITSDEINLLIWRYLRESGFDHTAYTFQHECCMSKSISKFTGLDIPAGALVSFLQKGLLYKEMEDHIDENGVETTCNGTFSLLHPHICDEPRVIHKLPIQANDNSQKQPKEDVDMMIEDEEEEKTDETISTDVAVLCGHKNEAFVCSWNPKFPFLASGSGDATARIWNVASGVSGSQLVQQMVPPLVLDHSNKTANATARDVVTLDWNPDGTILATGGYDGLGRLWTNKGELKQTLELHKGPIFAIKYNKKGDHLLTCSVDKTSVVWDANTGAIKQQFSFHESPVLDVDWRDDSIFASSSTDKLIYVNEIGKTQPLCKLEGHENEVNAIAWEKSGALLASCSDDFTAKLWNFNDISSKAVCKPVKTFNEHKKEIYTVKWNPKIESMIATASFDSTIKIWDIEHDASKYTFAKHSQPVYAIAYSPDGNLLASGSIDGSLRIWALKEGKLIKTHKGIGGIFDIAWSPEGDRLGVCLSSSSILVIDIKMSKSQ